MGLETYGTKFSFLSAFLIGWVSAPRELGHISLRCWASGPALMCIVRVRVQPRTGQAIMKQSSPSARRPWRPRWNRRFLRASDSVPEQVREWEWLKCIRQVKSGTDSSLNLPVCKPKSHRSYIWPWTPLSLFYIKLTPEMKSTLRFAPYSTSISSIQHFSYVDISIVSSSITLVPKLYICSYAIEILRNNWSITWILHFADAPFCPRKTENCIQLNRAAEECTHTHTSNHLRPHWFSMCVTPQGCFLTLLHSWAFLSTQNKTKRQRKKKKKTRALSTSQICLRVLVGTARPSKQKGRHCLRSKTFNGNCYILQKWLIWYEQWLG